MPDRQLKQSQLKVIYHRPKRSKFSGLFVPTLYHYMYIASAYSALKRETGSALIIQARECPPTTLLLLLAQVGAYYKQQVGTGTSYSTGYGAHPTIENPGP